MLDEVLRIFGVSADYDLAVMEPNQTLPVLTARILQGLERVFAAESPDMTIVQGDTTTTFTGALASFYAGVEVAHVEAGLRTGDMLQPFPEEMNRVLVSRLTRLHFASTKRAAANLHSEGVAHELITVTGNTGIDALLHVRDQLVSKAIPTPSWKWQDDRSLILVTTHRRESFGAGIQRICRALQQIAERPDVQIAFPVHPNPNVSGPVHELLGGKSNIHLLPPLDYVSFVDLARKASVIVTDSGGVQEEAPSLGKPVVVLRETTERIEAVEAGTATLVGTDPELILHQIKRILDRPDNTTSNCPLQNPYGDGTACLQITDVLRKYLNV